MMMMMEKIPQKMTLRLPRSLYDALRLAAAAEGISLNQYILYILAKHAGASTRDI